MKQIVFTDLDGTLLDPVTYSYEKSHDGISRLKESCIPINILLGKDWGSLTQSSRS